MRADEGKWRQHGVCRSPTGVANEPRKELESGATWVYHLGCRRICTVFRHVVNGTGVVDGKEEGANAHFLFAPKCAGLSPERRMERYFTGTRQAHLHTYGSSVGRNSEDGRACRSFTSTRGRRS